MKILALVTDAFGGQGGIAKFNRDLLIALCAMDHVQKVVAWPRVGSMDNMKLPRKLDYRTNSMNNKFKYVLNVFREAKAVGESKYLICGHINLLILACFLKKIGAGEKLFLIAHGVEVWKSGGWLKKRCMKNVDAVITVSDFTYQKWRKWAPIESVPHFILPNSIDLEEFTTGEKSENLKQRYGLKDEKVILTVARLDSKERYKGIDEMLRVLATFQTKDLDFVYIIVGDGDDKKRLTEKAKLLGVGDSVVFAGYIPEHEKVAHYQLADLYAMPGRGEGFGIVYLEALACGVPVIGSQLDGSQEALMGGKLGLLVDPDDFITLKNAVKKILSESHKKVPELLEYFSISNYQKRVSQIFNVN